ncbi:rhodanese-like domain-containing protein [Spirochaetota bacterium]
MNTKFIIILLAVFLVLAYCVNYQRNKRNIKLEKSEIKALIDQGAKVYDVRSQGEFRGGHYKGAMNIPLNDVKNRLKDFGDKDKPVIVYCHSGRRSGFAKKILEDNGYTKVYNAGGLSDLP